MITHLIGKLSSKEPTTAVVDVHGVGYAIGISLATYSDLPEQGGDVHLLTHMVVRDDRMELFGFATAGERELFLLLIGVSGVGPRLAQTILSGMAPHDLVEAIRAGRAQELTAIKGIGRRIAERVVLDLRDRLLSAGHASSPGGTPATADATAVGEAALALAALGYPASSARQAVGKAAARLGSDADVQDLIRQALKER